MRRGTVNGTIQTRIRTVVGESKEWVTTTANPTGEARSDAEARVAGQSTTPSNANNNAASTG